MKPRRCVAVAYSGGRDSTALLHATLGAAGPAGVSVIALHVHHGLSANADDWLAHCERRVRTWQRRGHDIGFAFERLTGSPARGESVEAWARLQRYQALRRLAIAHDAGIVLLAHHRRDQAETLLLQALRGSGPAGLAGMPASIERDGIVWARPWLAHASDDIAAYVRRHRLRHIEDESNADPRFARNRLRLQVWPALSAAFDEAEVSLAASARHAQQASACLLALAQIDIAACSDAQGLSLAPLVALDDARRQNLLRHWLRDQLAQAVPAALLQRLGDELPRARSARWPVQGGELRCHRGRLGFVPAAAAGSAPAAKEDILAIVRAGRYRLPGWGGVLIVQRVREGGVPFAWLGRLELRTRSGGERFQAGLGRPPRSLKKQFQAHGVAAWDRDGPLLWSGGQLIFVPGLGLDARVIGLPGKAQARLQWIAEQGTAAG